MYLKHETRIENANGKQAKECSDHDEQIQIQKSEEAKGRRRRDSDERSPRKIQSHLP